MSSRASAAGGAGAVWLLAISAFIMAGVMVKREFRAAVPVPSQHAGSTFMDELVDVRVGIEMARSDGEVKIVEFVDVECPACAVYHRDVVSPLLETITQRNASVSFRVVMFPLPVHRHAVEASHAAVCAHDQGHFLPFLTNAFRGQRDFESGPWARFAVEAGVADIRAFEQCLEGARPALVTSGLQLAESLRLRETPTIAVNGWVLPRPIGKDELLRLIDSLLDGVDPFRVD